MVGLHKNQHRAALPCDVFRVIPGFLQQACFRLRARTPTVRYTGSPKGAGTPLCFLQVPYGNVSLIKSLGHAPA
jgi:hypothetical protein